MLLQLEADGHINNLEEYPALYGFENNYIHWFDEFIDAYFDNTRRPFMAKHYVDYGNRIRALWNDRPNRPYPKYVKYLIGKTISKETFRTKFLTKCLKFR
eukprot:GHVR01093460.1.p1 GENE.GHVR01093460.1~~GHVR01093460.1.p1  ORF type:complete len:100 (-),score=0.21 GHVR01093460.1:898-1197(-)